MSAEPAATEVDGIALLTILGVELALLRGAGIGGARTAGLDVGLSRPTLVEVVGREVVLPYAVLAARLGRGGTGGGAFCLTGTGGASLLGVPGVLGADGRAREEAAWPSISPVPYDKQTQEIH